VALIPLNLPSKPLHPRELPRAVVPGLYVHIPFCFHKCHYCDFYSITRQSEERMTRFVDLLLREADMWCDVHAPTLQPQTIFFGGGTPSLLPLPQMERLLQGLRKRLDLSQVNEWTVEVNPATSDLGYCRMLRQNGVTRLSLGAQSFDRSQLKTLERHHDPEDVPRSLAIAREAGFERINFDLIYAIPSQTLESWMESLEAAIALNTDHLSCYALTYEPNTPIAVKKRMAQLIAATDELELQMLHATRQRLIAQGLPPYEISNYARPGEECRHNLLYWTGGSYVGLGPSASSHVEGTRFKNRPHLGEWESSIERGELPATDVESLTPLQRAGERMMLGLRLTQGVHLPEFVKQTGFDACAIYADQFNQLTKANLIRIDNQAVTLTERGIDVADAIATEFLTPSTASD
jgi:oxygen-independent coproporphyrinogen-3 oxidase